jgi:pilus assembly protein CpaF
VCFGELRTNAEFKLGLQIAQAGHPINCTFHSESSVGAVRRFLTAYLAESGNEPSDLALMTLTDLVRIIVVQKIMRDGRRRIIQISEVCGVMPDNPNMPDVRDLFVFELADKVDFDAAGNVKKIYGQHKRVGKLSERTIENLKLEGVSSDMFAFMMTDPEGEVETYDGKTLEELNI